VTPGGTLQLKGVPDLQPTFSVDWSDSTTATSPLPLPVALDGHDQWPLRGRRTELTSLAEIWRDVNDGRSRFVEVLGEPGVGTTSLARAFACQLHRQGAIVLHGAVGQGEAGPLAALGEAGSAATCAMSFPSC
jgi:AAA ATPase domain